MADIGRFNRLQINSNNSEGVILDGQELGLVLLPVEELIPGSDSLASMDVFLYHDNTGHLIATMKKPYISVGTFAWLTVVSITNVGAFLDWGLDKDLLLPFGEQQHELKEGKKVLVTAYLDERTQRVVATTRIDRFLEEEASGFKVGQSVELLISGKTDIGVKAIVNDSHWGVLYNNELFQPVEKGLRLNGYIKKIRRDKKLDLTLYQPGYEQIAQVCEQIVKILRAHDGYIMMTDKSSPEAVYSVFKVSKKVYKKAVGALYKQRRILIEPRGIRLLEDSQ